MQDVAVPDGERELIENAKRNRQAFAALYRRHYQTIARYVYRRVGDAHVTDDLVADVFMIALQTLPRYRHRGLPFRSWLYRIATNCVNKWARRRRKHVVRQIDEQLATEQLAPATESRGPERARTALLTVAPKYQAVLVLHYIEGMSVAEIARICGCRQGTVKSRLARGRDELRDCLPLRRSQL
jgi:RNA polymerase sigma-70 factor (ECF subfamily)